MIPKGPRRRANVLQISMRKESSGVGSGGVCRPAVVFRGRSWVWVVLCLVDWGLYSSMISAAHCQLLMFGTPGLSEVCHSGMGDYCYYLVQI